MSSDHVLLMAVIEMALISKRKTTKRPQLALEKIEDPMTKAEMSNKINSQIQPITPNIAEHLT